MIFLNTPIQEGVVILISGMTIVFIALILLFVVFNFIIPFILKKKEYESKRSKQQVDESKQSTSSGSGEEIAAVCSAVYMFLEEAHDEENAILTIGKSVKDYSPWSSKIYVTHRVAGR